MFAGAMVRPQGERAELRENDELDADSGAAFAASAAPAELRHYRIPAAGLWAPGAPVWLLRSWSCIGSLEPTRSLSPFLSSRSGPHTWC
jgi:hypothetical protein